MTMVSEHHVKRARLEFVRQVEDRFSFLEALGFRCEPSEPTLVTFEAPTMVINVYHRRHSYEIGLEITAAGATPEGYSFSKILRLTNPEAADQYKNYATHTREGVAEGVRRLADAFRRCIDSGILGDSRLFDRLAFQKRTLARDYANQLDFSRALNASEVAWRKKDYRTVTETLAPWEPELSALYRRKLAYARNHQPS